MVHGQPLRNLHLGSGSQQTSVLDTHPMYFPTLPAYSIQAQASSQPTMKWTAANSNTHSLEDGESGYVRHGRFSAPLRMVDVPCFRDLRSPHR